MTVLPVVANEEKTLSPIVVLGGTGFIGQKVMALLRSQGLLVISASRREGVDLTDYAATERFLAQTQPAVIFNCAAHVGSLHYVTTYAADVLSDNVQMTLNLYKAVAKVCPQAKIINPLSNCSYPGGASVQVESEWWNDEVHDSVFSYGNAKKIVYVTAKCYAKQYGIKSLNLLVPNTFGPGDSADPNKTHALNGMIIRMIQAQRAGAEKFEIWGSGQPVREWTYVDDVVRVMVAAMGIDADLLNPVNVAQNKGYSIKESAEFIAAAVGFSGQLVFNTQYQDGAPIKILDDQKFRGVFPDFNFFDHQKGIEETVAYYREIL